MIITHGVLYSYCVLQPNSMNMNNFNIIHPKWETESPQFHWIKEREKKQRKKKKNFTFHNNKYTHSHY